MSGAGWGRPFHQASSTGQGYALCRASRGVLQGPNKWTSPSLWSSNASIKTAGWTRKEKNLGGPILTTQVGRRNWINHIPVKSCRSLRKNPRASRSQRNLFGFRLSIGPGFQRCVVGHRKLASRTSSPKPLRQIWSL